MTDLEKVEKLREKADVSFAEAKEALDNANGDILDALIYLEKQGKSTIPAGGGYYSEEGASSGGYQYPPGGENHYQRRGETFSEMMKRFGRFLLKLLNKGNTNFLDATKGDALMFSCPVTAVIVLVLFFFWVTIPLFVISLFFGYRYRFRGEDLGRDSVNAVMDGAANAVCEVKKSFEESVNRADSKK
jgi:hypothetical protein